MAAPKINIVDLFAGCGGFTQGFHEFVPEGADGTPFRTVGAVEWDIAAATTYAANFAGEAGSGHIFPGDIKDWNPGDVEHDVDVILGGPPCQGFSGLGKEDPDDPRNKMWREYMRVVQKIEPKIFVIENVDRFFSSPEYAALREAADEKDGPLYDYILESRHLVAADYGVPQARKRAIVLATHRDVIAAHPDRTPLRHPSATHREVARRPKTEQAALWAAESAEHTETGGLRPWAPASTVFGLKGSPLTPLRPATTDLPGGRIDLLGKELPGSFRTTDLHIGRTPTDLSLRRYASIPEGGNRWDIPPELSTESWLNHRNGSGDVMGRLYLDRPSVTIRTEFYKPEKGRYLHPWADRPITHLEAALLQGFPTDYRWCGSKIEIARQIGNAVPVGLSRAIARQVHGYLAEARQLPGDG